MAKVTEQTVKNWCSSLKQVTGNDTWTYELLPTGYAHSFVHNGHSHSRFHRWVDPDKFERLILFYKRYTI
jgi:hypothetical protein